MALKKIPRTLLGAMTLSACAAGLAIWWMSEGAERTVAGGGGVAGADPRGPALASAPADEPRSPQDGESRVAGGRARAAGGAMAAWAEEGREPLAEGAPSVVRPAPDLALAGVVLEEGTRAPIDRARVSLDDGHGNLHAARTDEEGRFAIPWWGGVSAGLSVLHPAYVDLRQPDALLGEDDLELFLSRSGRIVGSLDTSTLSAAGAGGSARVIAWHVAASGERYWEDHGAEVALDGAFLLEDLDPGEYTVTALLDGGVVELEGGVQVLAGGTTRLDLSAGPGGALVGRVLWRERGQAVAGAQVLVVPRTQGLPRELRALRRSGAVTDADGRYRIEGLATGSWVAEFTLPWGVMERRGFDVPARGDQVELDMEVGGPAALSGAVLDAEGRGVDGAVVAVLPRGDQRALKKVVGGGVSDGLPRTTSGAGGAFQLPQVAPAVPLLVVAWPPPGRDGASQGVPGFAAAGPVEPGVAAPALEVVLPAALALEGIALDEAGEPIEGVEVGVERLLGQDRVRVGSAMTDVRGRFRFESLISGPSRVVGRARGYLTAIEEVDLVPGAHEVGVELVLPTANGLTGVVLDERGYGVPDLPVSLRVDPENDQPGLPSGFKQASPTDPFGRFHFVDLPPGQYLVSASSFAWRMKGDLPLDVFLPGAGEVEVHVVPRLRPDRAAIEGRVVLQDGGVPQGLEVSGLVGGVLEIDGGEFRATGLVPTRHFLRITADGHGWVAAAPIDLRPGSSHDAGVIELPAATALVVELRDAVGEPVGDARVHLVPLPASAGGAGEEVASLRLEPKGGGQYRNGRVPRGDWTLLVVRADVKVHTQVVAVEGPEQSVSVLLGALQGPSGGQ